MQKEMTKMTMRIIGIVGIGIGVGLLTAIAFTG
jgi:hypothetical protein